MKHILTLPLFMLITLVSFGQTPNSIDLDHIKQLANQDVYTVLFNRFLANDTTLTVDDYAVIYYGQAYRDNFQPNARHDSIRALNMYLQNNREAIDFNKVLFYTHPILEAFPFNIDQIFMTGVAYAELGNIDSANLWFNKYDKLIRSILSSGDGKRARTAIVVTKVSDEYALMNALKLQSTGQALTTRHRKSYDVHSLAPNDEGMEDIYFDIHLFLGKW